MELYIEEQEETQRLREKVCLSNYFQYYDFILHRNFYNISQAFDIGVFVNFYNFLSIKNTSGGR